ncbi:MAG: metallophosphoesterase [Rubrivivax sp.]|nr:metallophosphoesterase [Rubrivivax sp.]
MSVLRYVCLSDLHLGADYSLLTGRHGGHADPGKPGKCLLALGAAVRPLLRQLPVDTPPTLVLLGDVLDLGLSPMGDVAQAFQHVAEQAMLDEAGRPPFAPRVLVVPGNHDHHLWRQAQDHGYLQALRGGRTERDLHDLRRPSPMAPARR